MAKRQLDLAWIIIVKDRVSEEPNVYFQAFEKRVDAQNTAREIEAEDELLLATIRQIVLPIRTA